MDTRSIGLAGARGWRKRVANVAAGPVSKRSSLSEDQVRAGVGGLFLLLSIVYVASALVDLARRNR